MTQVRLRQIARLEKLAQPYIERRRQTEEQWQVLRSHAASHAAVFAFLIRYGNPTIDEPLSYAWQRCSQATPWIECWRRFPCCRILPHGHDVPIPEYPSRPSYPEHPFNPDSRNSTAVIGGPLRH